MPRDSKLYLEDMLAAAGKIRRYMAGLTAADFAAQELVVDAVARNLDILIHHYFGINVTIIWEIATDKLPDLEQNVRKLLAELRTDEE